MSITKELFQDGPAFPAKYEVCSRCRGTKTHVNPGVDGNGISADEMDELGDDFRDDYLGGVYDVACYDCGGEGMVLEFDRKQCSPDQLAEIDEWDNDMADLRSIERMERMMGA